MKHIKLLTLLSSSILIGTLVPITTSCNKNHNIKIERIIVDTKPTKTSYAKGEKFITDGLIVKAVMSDYSLTTLSPDKYSTSVTDGTRLMEIGKKTITINLKDSTLSTSFDIQIGDPVVNQLSITNLPDQLIYQPGEQLDLSGLKVKATFTDDTIDENYTNYTTEPANHSVLTESGKCDIKIKTDSVSINTAVLVLSQATEFSTCDWTNLGDWCWCLENQIIDEPYFCNHFLKNGVAITQISDLIGESKLVKVNNLDHKVVVIGTQHDTISGTTTKATLTFQFFNKITAADETVLVTNFVTEGKQKEKYLESQLRVNLVGTGGRTPKWVNRPTETRSIYDMLPADLKEYIPLVTKQIDDGPTTPVNYDDFMFLPTNTEYAQTGASEFTFLEEGQKYKYWETHNDAQYRIFKDAKSTEAGTNFVSWMPTIHRMLTNGAYTIYSAGSINTYQMSYPGALVPCFCI